MMYCLIFIDVYCVCTVFFKTWNRLMLLMKIILLIVYMLEKVIHQVSQRGRLEDALVLVEMQHPVELVPKF